MGSLQGNDVLKLIYIESIIMKKLDSRKVYLSNTVDEYNYLIQMVRLLCAVSVIVSHAFVLGMQTNDMLGILTNGKYNLGNLAVYILFFISGLYSIRSLVHKKYNFTQYIKNRIKKIWLPLLFLVLISVFVLGPFFSILPIEVYFSNITTYRYLLTGLFLIQHELPGVFINNIYPNVTNGALWTLPLELLCYISLVFVIRYDLICEKRHFIFSLCEVIIPFGISYYIFDNIEGLSRYNYHLSAVFFFYMGVCSYLYAKSIYINKRFGCVMLLLCIVSTITPFSKIILFITLPYIVLCFCFSKRDNRKGVMCCLGNYSYEMYLCGFVIQQCIVQIFGGQMNPYINIILCVPLDILAGYLLYNLVNKIYSFICLHNRG